jgi:HD-GYP domain-containing protein (c-di-GMP phosphodiesterase class II)
MKHKLELESPHFKQKLVRALIQKTPVAYSLIDKSYRIRFANDYLLKLRKLNEEDVIGEFCYNIANEGVPCPSCIVREAFASGHPTKALRKDILPDGSTIFEDDFAIPVSVEGDNDCILEVQIDRTREMELKEKTNFIFIEIVQSMIKILEKKDAYTSMHSRDVSAISSKLTWYMGLGDKAVFNATLGGLLHDLGKLHIPDDILNKKSKLDDKEFATIKEHPLFTYILLPDLDSFRAIREIAIAHHEKWDGTGYPNRLKGEEIPIEARIAAVADTYSAMTTDRSYRKGLGHDIAMEEIKKFAGTQFDPSIVEKFVQMVEEFGLDKDTLTCPDESTNLVQNLNFNHFIQRNIGNVIHPDGLAPGHHITDSEIDYLAASDSFINAIFDNTPANYMIIDESFNILYISEGFALALGKSYKELHNAKCFDATDKRMYCFQAENGCIRCPAIRSFASGQEEYSLLEENIFGQKFYYDTHAVPLELEDANGETIKCCLEIMFDRTKEKNAQISFENDLKQIIEIIYNLLSELDLNISGNMDEISAEANNFGDYLTKVQDELAGILDGSPGENK